MTRFSSGASLHRGKHLSLGGLDHILFVRRDVVGRLQHDFEALPRSFAAARQKTKKALPLLVFRLLLSTAELKQMPGLVN